MSNKRILVVSDTHGRHQHLDMVLEKVGKIDMLFHLGDVEGDEDYIEATAGCPVYMVAGNNDWFSYLPGEIVVTVGKYRIFMTHGHGYHVSRTRERLIERAREKQADIAMYGHTHRPDIDLTDDVKVINPGSLSHPRQVGRAYTYILMEIDENDEVSFSLCSL